METLFVVLVIVLILLAIGDLVVGVSNDAVNFLNSAIGSKTAPFWIIMAIASVGILFGATFSSGMMEVARKSIFHPEMFNFNEIMIIFLGVMLTDIILLDTYSTLGLPTSTTVSIVFELLGGAVAVAFYKLLQSNAGFSTLGDYINSGKALLIISGILISVVIAFSVGIVVQFIVRIAFTFKNRKSTNFFAVLWGAISITFITYFILVKGANGASFMSDEIKTWIESNASKIIIYSFVAWIAIFTILKIFTKLNILKIIVLAGTFGLALAFAGNDLVNFIGVPLAGLKSFEVWNASGVSANEFSMAALQAKVKTPTLYLMISGIIMVLTLWLSKKARSVTATELNLSKQDSGFERFESSTLSRFLVRQSIRFSNGINYITPNIVLESVKKRFEPDNNNEDKASAFDLVRASVNLVVASILISFATSLNLPLSTTYVTFMVAMGSSLADGAWGRESAVYRVSGVLTVIGGWFFTAFIAFTVSSLIAFSIYLLGFWVVAVYLTIAVLILIKSKIKHKARIKEDDAIINYETLDEQEKDITETCSINVVNTITKISDVYKDIVKSIGKESLKSLKKVNKEVNELNKTTKSLKDGVNAIIFELQEDSVETGHYYVQVLDYLREITHSLTYISKPTYEHFNNQHSGFIKSQLDELNEANTHIQNLISEVLTIIESKKVKNIDSALEKQQILLNALTKFRKNQVKRIKNSEVGTKNSMLYLNILQETKNLALDIINLLKAQRDFIIYQNNN
ncbi:MAG: inorganic phosphate transporter [Bacteroidales bacterium]|nr:inorganic phosphate transporter [Bacteroidales bacterium]MBN2757774.1 inorganic phosphate transporter [Bacteroidales bacterium]